MLVGVCGDDSALWRYGRKFPLTHTLPHYHVTWRIPAAPPLGDAFDLDLELEQRCFAALLVARIWRRFEPLRGNHP